jgi:hypothetical protein
MVAKGRGVLVGVCEAVGVGVEEDVGNGSAVAGGGEGVNEGVGKADSAG